MSGKSGVGQTDRSGYVERAEAAAGHGRKHIEAAERFAANGQWGLAASQLRLAAEQWNRADGEFQFESLAARMREDS